jgi:hypothetical protein
MSTVVSPSLFARQRLQRDEFLRRWEAMPEVKRAEPAALLAWNAARVYDVLDLGLRSAAHQ